MRAHAQGNDSDTHNRAASNKRHSTASSSARNKKGKDTITDPHHPQVEKALGVLATAVHNYAPVDQEDLFNWPLERLVIGSGGLRAMAGVHCIVRAERTRLPAYPPRPKPPTWTRSSICCCVCGCASSLQTCQPSIDDAVEDALECGTDLDLDTFPSMKAFLENDKQQPGRAMFKKKMRERMGGSSTKAVSWVGCVQGALRVAMLVYG